MIRPTNGQARLQQIQPGVRLRYQIRAWNHARGRALAQPPAHRSLRT